MRLAIALLFCLCGAAWAHGGAFRPPPRPSPRDPVRTPPGPGAVTTRSAPRASTNLAPWEAWWHYNRDRYTRLRERIRDRAVITGPRSSEDVFDRKALREELTPVLLEALRDDDPAVRGAAAIALGKFKVVTAVPALNEMRARDDEREVREASVVALMLMGDAAGVDVLDGIARDRKERRLARGLAAIGLGPLGARGKLCGILEEKGSLGSTPDREELHACAAFALGFTQDPAALAALSAIVRDDRMSDDTRGYAAASLGKLGHPLATAEALGLLGDRGQPDQVRHGAAISCGALVSAAETATVEKLARMADRDRDLGVRQLLYIALGQIGGNEPAKHLASSVRRKDHRVRAYAMLGLGLSGSDGAGPILLDVLEDLNNSEQRAACAIALALAGHEAAAPALRKEAERKHPAFLRHALLALGMLDDQEAVPFVREILAEANDPLVRHEAGIALALLLRGGAVPELIAQLDETKTDFGRASVATALGMVGNRAAVEPLLAIYRDTKRQSEERALALTALGRIGDPEDVPLLSRLVFDLHPFATADAIAELITIL